MSMRRFGRQDKKFTDKNHAETDSISPALPPHLSDLGVPGHPNIVHSGHALPSVQDKNCWWHQAGQPETAQPIFECIDEQLIIAEIKQKISLGELPMIEIPENIMRTLKLLDDPEFDYSEVTELIERSPAMAGEFIKIINSSFYSSVVAINDLKTAMHRLGQAKVKALLYLYSASMNFLGGKAFNGAAIKVVEHSYATGIIASYLSQRFYPDPDIAFLAGLLHDIGKLSIIKTITDTHELPPKFPFEITEEAFQKIFPLLHEQAGKYIADHWKIDKRVNRVIRHHHDHKIRAFAGDDHELSVNLCHLINVSDNIARMLGKGRPFHEPVNLYTLPSAKALGIEKNWSNVEFLKEIPAMITFKIDQ